MPIVVLIVVVLVIFLVTRLFASRCGHCKRWLALRFLDREEVSPGTTDLGAATDTPPTAGSAGYEQTVVKTYRDLYRCKYCSEITAKKRRQTTKEVRV